MKRIGILTAGGDTPALNATIHGAVTRASQRKVEVFGFIKGFSSLFNPRVPHVPLNPLYTPIPELDPTYGGTLIGASRDYVDADDKASVELIAGRLRRLGVEGLICIGGDGTLNGMQALCECLPTVLAPKTIDNDLGLNFRNEPDEWVRLPEDGPPPDGADVTESRLNVDRLVERIKEIYELQKHVVIVCGEGVVDEKGRELGAELSSTDPAGNLILTGASEALRSVLIRRLGDTYFTSKRRNE